MKNTACQTHLERMYPLPRKFQALQVLGEGGFGVVLQCWDRYTKTLVAIKYAKESVYTTHEQEAFMLEVLMNNNLDKKNIVKFHAGFFGNRCLVFENLDISLYDYVCDRGGPMRLQDIRTVIKQLAIALDGLKSIGVIHTDLKMDNIMLVDQKKQPFKVKLIDFGLAIFKSNYEDDRTFNQLHFFRAPEAILDLPVSEALDMWSLGCMMARMVLGYELFPAKSNHELLKYIIALLGPPPNHIITDESIAQQYFNKNVSNQWKLKKPKKERRYTDYRIYTFRSLDEIKEIRQKGNNPTEAEDRSECIELLKAMLKWDGEERITPHGILNHPFITKSYLNHSCNLTCRNETDSRQADENMKKTDVDYEKWNRPICGPIIVKPAPRYCTITLKKRPDEDSNNPGLPLVSVTDEEFINPGLSSFSVTDEDLFSPGLSPFSVTDEDLFSPGLSLVSVTDEEFISPGLSLVSVTDEEFISPGLSLVSVTDEDFICPGLSLVSVTDEDFISPGLSLVSVTDEDFINPGLTLVSVTDEDFINPGLTLVSVTDEDFINPGLTLVSVTDEDFINPGLSLVSVTDKDFINPGLSLVSETYEDAISPSFTPAPNVENTNHNNHSDHTGDNKSKKKKNCFQRFLSCIRRRFSRKVGDVAM